jgi:hypothetical protein
MKKNFSILSVFFLILSILYFRGFPFPHIDDLAYVGAGITLHETGVLENRFQIDWSSFLETKNAYYYTPFYFYLVKYWSSIFGISATSFHNYYWCFLIIGMISVYLFLRKIDISQTISLFFLFIFSFIMLKYGLRPDTFSYAFMFAGLSLFSLSSFIRCFTGLFFIGISILILPVCLFIAVPLFISLCFHLYRTTKYHINISVFLLSLFISVISVFFIFLNQIDYNFFEWLHAFNKAVSVNKVNASYFFIIERIISKMLTFWRGYIFLIPYSTMLLATLFLFFLSNKKKTNSLIYILPLFIIIILLNGFHWYGLGHSILFVWMITIVCLNYIEKIKPKSILWFIVVFSFVISQFPFILQLLYSETKQNEIHRKMKNYIYQEIKDNNTRIIFDHVSAKYIFDYKLPPHSYDFSMYEPYPRFRPNTIKAKKENEIWVVARWNFTDHIRDTNTVSRAKQITFLKKELGSVYLEPQDIILLPKGSIKPMDFSLTQ